MANWNPTPSPSMPWLSVRRPSRRPEDAGPQTVALYAAVSLAAAAWLACTAQYLGARLVPDTALYERRGVHLWPSPLGGLAGTIAGHLGVVTLAAIAAASCALLVCALRAQASAPLLSLPALACVPALFLWASWPSMDAPGAALVLLAVLTRRRTVGALSGLVHPVAGLMWAATLLSRRTGLRASWLALGAAVFVALVVGELDSFTTTDRYFLPGVLLWAAGR